MKDNEEFALKYFLNEYPKDMAFRNVLEVVRGRILGWVDVWEPFQSFDSNILVGLIVTLKNQLDDLSLAKK